MHGGHVMAPIFFRPDQMRVVLGSLGVDMGWLLARGLVCGWLCSPCCAYCSVFPNILLSM